MLIQTVDPGRALQRRYRLTSLPSALLSEEVVPVVLVDDLAHGDTFDQPTDSPCIGGMNTAPNVGETTVHAFAPTRGDCILEELWLAVGTATTVILRAPSVGLSGWNLSAASFRDRRKSGQPNAALLNNSVAAIPAGQDIAFVRLAADTTIVVRPNMLVPAFVVGQPAGRNALPIYTGDVDVVLRSTFVFRERFPAG